ncbi:grifin isoform X3 [Manis pentadactyla]|uniref:grifin isoform X3 n=1 Tax=Manis pentadactyla TaxID=143292 RepID=UPI00255CCBEE|nr:grifin isoform X3 [Manis pentadactyla]
MTPPDSVWAPWIKRCSKKQLLPSAPCLSVGLCTVYPTLQQLLSTHWAPAQFEAFCAGGLAPGWSLLVRAHSDAGEDRFEINFLSETGDIAFHIKPRFSSATMVGNAFQGGHWGQEEVSSVFPLVLGEPFEMEVSSDSGHFHVHAQEHKVLQFAHRHRPLADITRVQVLSDHRLAQVELARRDLSWWDGGH